MHTNLIDIRQCLYDDGKHGEESSPMAAEVTRVISGERQRSGPVMQIPRAKEALGSED
jgi:hypothetical protein